jgi:hypothetical protein
MIGMKGFITYHKVSNLAKFRAFVSAKYPEWIFYTIYDKATRQKVAVEKP